MKPWGRRWRRNCPGLPLVRIPKRIASYAGFFGAQTFRKGGLRTEPNPSVSPTIWGNTTGTQMMNKQRKKIKTGKQEILPVSEAWERFDRLMRGELDQDTVAQDQPVAERTEPVRPAYDDWPAVTTYSVYRQYNPEFYGRQAGTRWPVTDAAAARSDFP